MPSMHRRSVTACSQGFFERGLKYGRTTLCVLVAAYEKIRRTVGKTKLKPLDVLQEFVAEHRMKVRELGTLLGVSESAGTMILTGERTLTLDQVRKLAERFKVSTDLFVG